MFRGDLFAADEYYHIFNRGNHKEKIFHTKADYIRFLFLILYLQSPHSLDQMSRLVKIFSTIKLDRQSPTSKILEKLEQKVINNRFVELVGFALMPNHFHLFVRAITDDGVSKYMQKILTAFTKYSNTKNETVGHVFQGPFGCKRIEDNDQLLYLSTYIHRNPKEIPGWEERELEYPWSSFQDYITKNRFENLLKPEIILDQFTNTKEYRKFVDDSIAKDNDYFD